VEAVEKVLPSVVNISTTKEVTVRQSPFGMRSPFLDFNFPLRNRTYQLEGLGSGVVVEGGYVITNNHVVDYDFGPADKIYVALYGDNEPHEAEIVGTDPMDDIAVLAVKEPFDVKGLSWGRSDDLMIGETVIAVGSSLGQPFTVTDGIISALNRTISEDKGVHLTNLIQTNADINQGNSGGPLVNINGEFIGLNTAIISPSGGSVGLGFAIPVSRVKKVFDYWVNKKLTIEDQLKIYVQDLSLQLVMFYNEEFPQLRGNKLKGVVVTDVIPGGLAENQLEKIDIIETINGEPVNSPQEFADALELLRGNEVKFGIWRDGKKSEVVIPVKEEKIESITFLGMELQEMDSHWRRRLDLSPKADYLVVTSVEPNSTAANEGIQRGDVLESLRVNTSVYESLGLDEADSLRKRLTAGQEVMTSVLRKYSTYSSSELSWKRIMFRLKAQQDL
jgi:S1-C subfamily serine protease